MNNTIHYVIKDPVHCTMQFSHQENAWIRPFIDSANFQRLRHIKQLGMGDLIFPGAVHTRFNHSLGCSFVASQIAHKIGLPEEERQLVMIAGLLHDIGHGPFSHAFEDVMHEKMIRHEDWTPFFLSDYQTSEFYSSYEQLNPAHPFDDHKFKLIENMIMHKPVQKRVLADIVSSQLDADRLDYLLRDSHFCGVNYGEFDFSWMLNCMAIIHSDQGERLGITHKGVGIVEQYLMARRLMIRNIYHLEKKLALEFFMVKFLQQIAENIETYAPFSIIKYSLLGQFLIKVNEFNQGAKISTNLQEHKKAFLEKNYSHYKELCDYDIFMMIKAVSHLSENHPATQLARRIQQRQMPEIMRLTYNEKNYFETIINEFKEKHANVYQPWQINLIQTPHQSYKKEADPILVIDESGMIQPITDMSLMIQAISEKHETMAFLCIDKHIAQDKNIQQLQKLLMKDKIQTSICL